MEGKRANRSGWWLTLLSSVVVVAMAITAAWRWATAQEGTINGERATVFIERTASEMGPGTARLNSETDLKADAKAVLTLLRVADGMPTLLESCSDKLRNILPRQMAVRLFQPKLRSKDRAAQSILIQLINRSRSNGSPLFGEALAILPDDEATSLGLVLFGLAQQSPEALALVQATVDRLLASSNTSANDVAVALQMQPRLDRAPPSPAWFRHAERLARGGTNFVEVLWEMPGYLRRQNVANELAFPILNALPQSTDPFVRIEAQIELWRRNQSGEPAEVFIRRLSKAEGIGGFDRVVSFLKKELRLGEKNSLPVVNECISQLGNYRSRSLAFVIPNSPSFARTTRTPGSSMLSVMFGSPFRPPYYDLTTIGSRVVAFTEGLESELQPQADTLVSILKSRSFSRNDRLAVAELLQKLPAEPPEVVDLLVQGVEDKSLGLGALRYLGKYGPKVADKLAGVMDLLNSSDFTERQAAAGFFKRATPANPALLDRWIAGLRDSGIQAIAVEALGDYGPTASKAALTLAELVASDSRAAGLRELRLTSIASLRKIRPEYSVVSAALLKALNDKPGARLHAEIVSAAKAAILDLAPADHSDRQAAMRVP